MRFGRNPWPIGIVLIFILFFAGVAAVIIIASRQSDSLVSENYYERELKYQDQINAAARAKNAGAVVRLDAASGKILVTIPAEQVKQNLSGQMIFYRASSSEMDKEIKLQPDAGGLQAVDVSGLADGPWLVRVRWSAGGQDYYLEQKITLPGK
jgi:hypothetical protein